MAKITMPLLSGQVRGKLGDIVFFRRNGKNLARVKTIPANPRTVKQETIRYNTTALSRIWKGENNVTVKKVTSLEPFTVTDVVVENGLTTEEKNTWIAMYDFLGVNQKRLWNNLNIVKTK